MAHEIKNILLCVCVSGGMGEEETGWERGDSLIACVCVCGGRGAGAGAAGVGGGGGGGSGLGR